MDFLRNTARLAAVAAVMAATTGCYYLHTGYHQSRLIHGRRPLDSMLVNSSLSEEHKRKLRLVREAKEFAEGELGLKRSSNYTTYVQLDQPYVSYIVQAAHAYELKPYLWSFPIVGKMPYKGYFRKHLAEAEARSFNPAEYDTYVRGVSAYSTLGWFDDSILSSMLRYDDHELVETIIHETIHADLYIKNASQFNERMATYLGHEGMKLFYLRKEGPDSPRLTSAEADSHDQKIFSEFLTQEVKSLKAWYEERKNATSPETKKARLKEIQDRFIATVRPRLRTGAFAEFATRELNNALILAYETYQYDLADFDRLFAAHDRDFKRTMEYLRGLRDAKDPDAAMKKFLAERKPAP